VILKDNDGNSDDESEYVPSENECISSDNDASLHKKISCKKFCILAIQFRYLKNCKITSACNNVCSDQHEVMYACRSNVKSKQNCCVFV